MGFVSRACAANIAFIPTMNPTDIAQNMRYAMSYRVIDTICDQ